LVRTLAARWQESKLSQDPGSLGTRKRIAPSDATKVFGQDHQVVPMVDVVPDWRQCRLNFKSGQPCESFPQHAGSAPSNTAKHIRDVTMNSHQIVTTIEARS